MTNQECSAEVLVDWADSEGGLTAIDMDYGGDMTGAGEALADAGLLMEDLPKPDGAEEGKPYWYSSTYGIAVGQLATGGRQNVIFWDSEPGGVTYDSVEGARELAYALLAAAKHAEEQE